MIRLLVHQVYSIQQSRHRT